MLRTSNKSHLTAPPEFWESCALYYGVPGSLVVDTGKTRSPNIEISNTFIRNEMSQDYQRWDQKGPFGKNGRVHNPKCFNSFLLQNVLNIQNTSVKVASLVGSRMVLTCSTLYTVKVHHE
ncbi:hypothetical protein Pfo_014312 [Paulownia fortunei]|nr:hypothetical protein Pfo_014312 [Paulownia fortunei]